jgi:hypothetical protein
MTAERITQPWPPSQSIMTLEREPPRVELSLGCQLVVAISLVLEGLSTNRLLHRGVKEADAIVNLARSLRKSGAPRIGSHLTIIGARHCPMSATRIYVLTRPATTVVADNRSTRWLNGHMLRASSYAVNEGRRCTGAARRAPDALRPSRASEGGRHGSPRFSCLAYVASLAAQGPTPQA